MAEARLHDAEVLLANGCHDGAAYLCGYAVELALKRRICIKFGWPDYKTSRAYNRSNTFRRMPLVLSTDRPSGDR